MTRLLNLLATVLLTMPAVSLAAQALEIKLVDGRNGRPMVGTSAYVNIWAGGERKEAIAIPTDSNGVARLQLTLNPNDVNVPNSTGPWHYRREHIIFGPERKVPHQNYLLKSPCRRVASQQCKICVLERKFKSQSSPPPRA